MLEAAVNEAAKLQNPPKLLAVTLLTSMDELQIQAIGLPLPAADQVLKLARMACATGVDGVVASPLETAALRAALGTKPLLVIPGIRSATDAADDQRRTASPADAIASGASMLVVGRPITRAVDPVSAARAILQQITAANSL